MTPTVTGKDARPLLRPAEAAELLAVSRKTVYRLIDRGDLCAVQVGGVLRIDASNLTDYLNRGELRDYVSSGGAGRP